MGQRPHGRLIQVSIDVRPTPRPRIIGQAERGLDEQLEGTMLLARPAPGDVKIDGNENPVGPGPRVLEGLLDSETRRQAGDIASSRSPGSTHGR